jgi:hypothetical protein
MYGINGMHENKNLCLVFVASLIPRKLLIIYFGRSSDLLFFNETPSRNQLRIPNYELRFSVAKSVVSFYSFVFKSPLMGDLGGCEFTAAGLFRVYT